MGTTEASTAIALEELAARALQAWNRHDVDGIVRDYAKNILFTVHDGTEPAVGQDAARSKVEAIFDQLPNLRFDTSNVLYGMDFFVVEFIATARVVGEDGAEETVAFPVVDVIKVHDGLVASKTSYVGPPAP